MSDLDKLNTALRESSVLAKNRQFNDALRLLNEAIADAKRENRSNWVLLLSQHAAVISEPLGDPDLTAQYCKDAVDWAPDDALAHYALANALHRQGKVDLAMRHAIKSYSLVAHSGTMVGKGLVELIIKRWPQIVQ